MARPKQQRIDPKKTAQAARSRSRVIPPKVKARPARLRDWIGAARIRTLTLAIAPVALGTASAYLFTFEWHWVRAVLCLAVALLLQIGVNFANDYSDGVRGTDAHRVGPARLTASGAVAPKKVLAVALVFFALAAVAGLALVVLSGHWWLLAVGAACILAAWFYTGGKRPYGYAGLGELFVFVFFGIVAVAGTQYVQVDTVTLDGWVSGAAAGLLACAVLVSNNMRDIEQDRVAGKRTLSVLIGLTASRVLFIVLLLVPFVLVYFYTLLLSLAGYVFFLLLLAVPTAIIAATAKTAPEFLLVLKLSSLTALLYGLGLAAAIVF